MSLVERRPIIGLVTGNSRGSVNAEREFHEQLAGVADIATTRVPLFRISYSDLEKLIENLPLAVDILAASGADVIVWNSVTGSSLHGQETANLMEQRTGLPMLIPSIEFVNCLQKLRAQRIALATPHGVELSLLEKIFFDRYQIEVVKMVPLVKNATGDVREIDNVTPEGILSRILERDFSDVDALVFDNPACPILPIIKELEAHVKKPILPHNQVLMWAALRRIGIPTDAVYIDTYFR